MSRQKFLTNPDESQLGKHVNELRDDLRERNPEIMAMLTGSQFAAGDGENGVFSLEVWGRAARVNFPDFIAVDETNGEELSISTQALLAYYFHIADGTAMAERWIAFSELPDGRFYTHAFQGYTGRELARVYLDDTKSLARAADKLPRASVTQTEAAIGDKSFSFQALPRVPLLLVYWQGDEDFPSSYQILFEASVSHYLNTDVCAILGSMLTRKLIGVKQV